MDILNPKPCVCVCVCVHVCGIFTNITSDELLCTSCSMCSACCLSQVRLFANPVDCSPPPLSMKFPRQEYWSRVPFPSPGDLSYPWIEPMSLVSLASADRFFTTSSTRENLRILLCAWADVFPAFEWSSNRKWSFLNLKIQTTIHLFGGEYTVVYIGVETSYRTHENYITL